MTRTAVVTGASKGLGRTIACFLAQTGYDVVITARHDQPLHDAARDLRKLGAHVTAIVGDAADPAHRKAIAGAVRELDVLVNNASELGPSPMPALAGYPLDELRHVFDVNVVAPIALTQDLLPALRERKGIVVNVTSDAAVGAYENWGGYGASKAALELASKTMANELEDVAVVAVDPGDMRTDMHQAAFPGEDISDRPLPDVTIPFWAWLFEADRRAVNGHRYRAQGESWELAS